MSSSSQLVKKPRAKPTPRAKPVEFTNTPETSELIPLYQYQKEISEELHELVLDNDYEVTVEKSKLITQGTSLFITSPLGSGKTRMVARTCQIVAESRAFEEKNYSFTILGKSNEIKTLYKTKIFIICPVTVIPQWKEELSLWHNPFYTIAAPRDIKPLTEIAEKIILISDYRTKDIPLFKSKDDPPKQFVDEEYQFYIFIDEYDTIKINTAFLDTTFDFVKTKICISANYDGKDYFPVNRTIINLKQLVVTSDTVSKSITLPHINESALEVSCSKIFKDIFPYLSPKCIENIKIGNITTFFTDYNLSPSQGLLRLFKALIEEKEQKKIDHIALPTTLKTPDAFTKRMDSEVKLIMEFVENNFSECVKCEAPIGQPNDGENCGECFMLVCNACAAKDFTTGFCNLCHKICKGDPVDLSDEVGFNKTRLHCLVEILRDIRERDSTIPKKVLVYCSHHNLVKELNQLLESNNFWTMTLDGSSSIRLGKVNKFKAVDTDIYLVCNSIQNSAGIHLPETTDIIIYHEMESKYDTQVVGRAQRIGRTTNLFLHRITDSA